MRGEGEGEGDGDGECGGRPTVMARVMVRARVSVSAR